MTAPHFFSPSVDADVMVLSGEDARHAARVLRLRPGEAITISDGAGTVVDARIRVSGAMVEAEVVSRRFVPAASPRVVVFQAVPKAGKLELIVQKLTELGVEEIVPLAARRSVSVWDSRGGKLERLRTIARQAAMQSRRAWLPWIADPAIIDDVPEGAIVLHEEASGRLGDLLPAELERLTLVIGPEGGFEGAEVDSLREKGCVIAGLGPQILRTETAALAAVAIALFRYRRLG